MRGLKFVAAASLLLIGLVSTQVTIEPQNSVVRPDQVTRLLCKSKTPLTECHWEINSDLLNPRPGSGYELFGDLTKGECGIQVRASEDANGRWVCRVFVPDVREAILVGTQVTVVALPSIKLNASVNPIKVEAGKPTSVKCTVANARPQPDIKWLLDGSDLSAAAGQQVHNGDKGKVTVISTLVYTFQAGDYGKKLRCVTNASWLEASDPSEASVGLDVSFAPEQRDTMTLYGFELGKLGDVIVNFSANPGPATAYWKVDETPELDIVPFLQSTNPLFDVFQLTSKNSTTFEARLRIKSVSEEDTRRLFQLVAGWEDVSRTFGVKISTATPPAESDGLSPGGTAGVVIGVTGISAIIAVVFYARNARRWCFAR